jgi:6-pyruvoyltetrahydropterin/6-carboxytetrahydropterin synthase
MTYVISKEIEFDAGHRVPNHDSKCKNPHGHRYKVKAYIEASDVIRTPGDPREGMLADFGFLKQALNETVGILDHAFIVWKSDEIMKACFRVGPPTWAIFDFPYIPTAENLAMWTFLELEEWFRAHGDRVYGFHLKKVTIYETPTSVATYWKELSD